MTTKRVKKRDNKGDVYKLGRGVGIFWETNDHGWGLENPPHLAVMSHPISGKTIWGPFKSAHNAEEFIRMEGREHASHYYGGDDDGVVWNVVGLLVPTEVKA